MIEKSIFSNKLEVSLNIFQWLTDICINNNIHVFYLSKKSNLKKIKSMNFLSFDGVKKKFSNKFI